MRASQNQKGVTDGPFIIQILKLELLLQVRGDAARFPDGTGKEAV